MPIPVRATPVKAAAKENRQLPSSSLPPPARGGQRKLTKGDRSESVNVAPNADADVAASIANEPTSSSQSSSRIPSPFKRNPSSQSNRSIATSTSINRTHSRGHTRQQSAVTPSLAQHYRPGHSRSTSAVSSTTSISSGAASRILTRPRANVSERLAPLQKAPIPITASSKATSSLRSAAPVPDAIRSELLQLSVTHDQSGHALKLYQSSVDASIETKRSELLGFREEVRDGKARFSAIANLSAIDEWVQADGVQKTCQALQDLSVAIRDVQNLVLIFSGTDGLSFSFETWVADINNRNVNTLSGQVESDPTLHLTFEDRLRPDLICFQEQVATTLACMLGVSACSKSSAIYCLIDDHTKLAQRLLSECQVMLKIGRTLASTHRQRLTAEVEAAVEEAWEAKNRPITTPILEV